MFSFSLIHWLVVAAVIVLTVYPVSIILKKAGQSPWWAVVALVPGLNYVGLWILALIRWPNDHR